MRLLDISYKTPAKNLAVDEVLLESVARGESPCVLRFWESPVPFVVIGSSQRAAEVARVNVCMKDGVPVMRRCSAGGAVLQGPGCLNYALALAYDAVPEVASLHESYGYILDRVAAALASLGIPAGRAGISDLAVAGMKCSGNAQRRKKNACLHHGTLLYRADPDAMARYLAEPEDRPEYRGGRTHGEFVAAAAASPRQLREALIAAFCPGAHPGTLSPEEMQAADRLVMEKYSQNDWTYRR